MPIGEQHLYIQRILGTVWSKYNEQYANGELSVTVPTKSKNPRNPLNVSETGTTEYTFYGLYGNRPKYNSDGTVAASSIDAQRFEFMIPTSALNGLTYEELDNILRTNGTNIFIDGQPSYLRSSQFDEVANAVVIVLDKVESS